jgi:hypothetical protein
VSAPSEEHLRRAPTREQIENARTILDYRDRDQGGSEGLGWILAALERKAYLAGWAACRERAAVAMSTDAALLEVLADAEHRRWAAWMDYQRTAPPEKRADWPRKAALAYWALTEVEKESDRIEARKTLAIVCNFVRALEPEGERSA